MKKQAQVLLKKLTQAHGCSGVEYPVRRIFEKELHPDAVCDNLGNAICVSLGSDRFPNIMLEAHIDEVGFMVQTILSDGLLKFVAVGGWWSHTLLAQRVRILTQKETEILGVISAKPPHFLKSSERERVVSIDEMYIDVGARDAEQVRDEFGISVGDTIVPDSEFQVLNDTSLIMSKAFDDRVGVAAAIQITKELKKVSHPNCLTTVGSTQEEVGLRGVRTVMQRVEPDVAIVLEASPADDLPNVANESRQCAIGKGPQIRFMDSSAILNRPLTRYAIATAEELSIPYQVAVRSTGGTDAGAIQHSGKGVPTVVVGVPARYIHTHNSIIDLNDYLNTLKLVLSIIRRLDENEFNRILSSK